MFGNKKDMHVVSEYNLGRPVVLLECHKNFLYQNILNWSVALLSDKITYFSISPIVDNMINTHYR